MANRRVHFVACVILLLGVYRAAAASDVPEEARAAFSSGDYSRAIQVLDRAAAAAPNDAAVQHLLARS